MLNSMVLLALVTSVQWTPPDLPPVRHCATNKVNIVFHFIQRTCLWLLLKKEACDYPNKPGVDCAKHGAVRDHSLVDLVHVVHQPAKFDGAEVSADREPRFMLQGGNDMNVNLLCEAIHKIHRD